MSREKCLTKEGNACVKSSNEKDSTLGPLLFLIYINDLNDALDKCRVHHFADDTLVTKVLLKYLVS